MDARLIRSRLFAIVLASISAWSANAGGVYKYIDSSGAIIFTDVPPSSEARVVAQADKGATTGEARRPGMPYFEMPAPDEAMARANAQMDGAEHNLAVARQGLWSPHDGLSLAAERMTAGDRARVAYYRNGVQIARQQLMDLLRQRLSPP